MRAALLVAIAFALTGCGHAVSGKRVFAADCAGCHTLTGHDTPVDGGDLGGLRLNVAAVESFARVMPVRPRLSPEEAHAVAVYVLERR
jgi:mono/diheme cytochrome c family protein